MLSVWCFSIKIPVKHASHIGLCCGLLEKKIDELSRDNAILAYQTNAIGPAVVAKVQLIF